MRADDSRDLLAGYVSGPAAATEATLAALPRAAAARAIVLVEGVSDQIAVETLAARHGRDLTVEGVVVLPTGGAGGMTRYLRLFGPEGTGARLAGLCDAAEEHIVRRGLAAAGLGSPGTRADLERLGFAVCVADLEDELIRAAGPALAAEVLAAHGDLSAFRTIQRQPGLAGKGRGGAVAALPRRGLAAQAPLRPAADRGDRLGPDAAAAGGRARRRLTLGSSCEPRRTAPDQAGCDRLLEAALLGLRRGVTRITYSGKRFSPATSPWG